MVIASIEAQGKFVQETMKNYLALVEVVDKLRSAEEAKIEVRGRQLAVSKLFRKEFTQPYARETARPVTVMIYELVLSPVRKPQHCD